MANEKHVLCTGACSSALGADAQIRLFGNCNHPQKREVSREYLDGLPIPERAWTHCIFYRLGGCVFAGECQHKEVYKDGK